MLLTLRGFKMIKDIFGINNLNQNKKIKLRIKEKKDGTFSLYLDFFSNKKRQYHFLNIYLSGDPKNKKADIENLKMAQLIRDKKELSFISQKNDLNFTTPQNMSFFSYYAKKSAKKSKGYESVLNLLKDFAKTEISFKNITHSFCLEFYNYIITVVSYNSAANYMTLFKFILNQAVKDGIILKNPASDISTKKTDTKRAFLSLDEVKKLLSVKPKKLTFFKTDIRNAFTFSCFTGLRLSDIKKLMFSDIKDGYIEFKQKKTGGEERIKLNHNALSIIENQKSISSNNYVFNLPSDTAICLHLRKFALLAGIDKHITFHCARHTFATMCLTSDIDIFTVSKLLGHRDLKTTQIYAKLIDKKKDDAIDKLPVFDI